MNHAAATHPALPDSHDWKGFFTSRHWRGRRYLLSPFADAFMAGGGALLVLLAMILFIPYQKTTPEDLYTAAAVATVVFMLQYVANYPHFIVSYQLFYANFPERLARFRGKPGMYYRVLNAGIVMPVLLVAFLGYTTYVALAQQNLTLMAYALHSMLFFVGWHYVKQSFGVFMMLSGMKKIYYRPLQRKVLLWNGFAVWLCAWVYTEYTNTLLGPAFQEGYGDGKLNIPYKPIHFPDWVQAGFLGLAVISTLALLVMLVHAWRKEGKLPSFTALIGYMSMYYLFGFAAVLHPEWALIVPFFHSVQYLMFVTAYKRGMTRKQLKEMGLSESDIKTNRDAKKLVARRQLFFGWAFMIGLMSFYIVPTFLDIYMTHEWPGLLPGVFFVLVFNTFINVHHYFIDNVIWRRDNPEVGEYLFGH